MAWTFPHHSQRQLVWRWRKSRLFGASEVKAGDDPVILSQLSPG
jgi:hypothetical protein